MSTPSLTRDDLLVYMKEKLKVDVAALTDETPLFSSSLIDSFSMVDLVVFLEKQGGFKLSPTDVSLDNLDSIQRIMQFVERSTSA